MTWIRLHNPGLDFANNSLVFDKPFCQKRCNVPGKPARMHALWNVPKKARPDHLPERPVRLNHIDIAPVSARACEAYKRRKYQLFHISIEDIDQMLRTQESTENPLNSLPPEFQEFADVFSPKEADKLLPHRPHDHDIKLLPGENPPFGPLYPMSRNELTVLKE